MIKGRWLFEAHLAKARGLRCRLAVAALGLVVVLSPAVGPAEEGQIPGDSLAGDSPSESLPSGSPPSGDSPGLLPVDQRLLPQALSGRAQMRLLPPTPAVPRLPAPSESVGLAPSESAILAPAEPTSLTVVVQPGDNITKILRQHSLPESEIRGVIEALASFTDPNVLQVGQSFTLRFTENHGGQHHFTSLSFRPDGGHVIKIALVGERWQATLQRPDHQVEQPIVLSATVDSSLYQAAVDEGVPHKIIHEFVRVFSQEVDFRRDVLSGTQMHVLFTCTATPDGVLANYGAILAARLDFGHKQLYTYRYSSPVGVGYFDEDGRSLHLGKLGPPLQKWDVSSPYGPRVHPRSGRVRMHHGIDLRSPEGALVMATGNGEIIFMSLGYGYGNYIKIQHDDSIETRYAHLSRFASELRVGHWVNQGQVIGYVGSTGISTGPHLHYEIRKDGESLDPAQDTPQLNYVLVGDDLDAFRRHTRVVDRMFRESPSVACDA